MAPIPFLSLLLLFSLTFPSSSSAFEQQPLLKYHHGPLLKGNITVNLVWYGKFSSTQRSIIVDFLNSLSNPKTTSPPSVSSWWRMTAKYRGGSSSVVVGKQTLDDKYSLGKALKTSQLEVLAFKYGYGDGKAVNVVLTSADVAVDGFCMSRCGTHGSVQVKKSRFPYAWVGNLVSKCPGYCAWPFHQPVYGPQTPPMVAPNGDVGVDGMVINLATVLAGTVAPLEAVSACTGIFGKGAFPGYPGKVLMGKTTGASYNAVGVNGRKYLLPAMWDPQTSTCKTLL
ncbi:hypothetical protein ES332_A05G243300v1 [Gossypium tomentosum]|uniref:Protein EXORDIUM-like 2 n=1 Tax=Gossypium tomentosum TaxID=34277 RepID=A0A5D2QIE3_GOSTO|nr:hypothetical protein ES332_A05G243300v1 [Gossypium tomentosum]